MGKRKKKKNECEGRKETDQNQQQRSIRMEDGFPKSVRGKFTHLLTFSKMK